MADTSTATPPPPSRGDSSPRARDTPTDGRSRSSRRGRSSNRRRPAAPAAATSTVNGESSTTTSLAEASAVAVTTPVTPAVVASGKAPRPRSKKASAKTDGKNTNLDTNANAATTPGSVARNVAAAAPIAPPTPVETLIQAIRTNDIAAFHAVLAAHPDLDINKSFTRDGDTALVEACRFARFDMATLLLRGKQVNVNVASTNKRANRHGLTPLIAACTALDAPLVELLLQDATSPTFKPAPTIKLLAMYGRVNALVVCALYSVANGHTDAQNERATALLAMLLTFAQQTDQLPAVLAFETEKGNRLAHIVAGVANWRALAVLQSFDADVRSSNRIGKTPLAAIEANALERRSLAYYHEATKATTKIERNVETLELMRTFVALAKSIGFATMFVRKHDGAISFPLRCQLVAHVGFVALANNFATAADAPTRAEHMDGLIYTLVAMHSTSLKRTKEFATLWQRALAPHAAIDAATDLTPVTLTRTAFQLIVDDLLAPRSLSRRVQTMASVLMHLEAPYARNAPLPLQVNGDDDAAADRRPLQDLSLYCAIAERLYRSGVKLLFCVFDRTDIDEDESYDEEIEFHLLLALTELFLQCFVPFAHCMYDNMDNEKQTPQRLSAAVAFERATASIYKLWPLVVAGMASIDDPIASPQRFSLLLHVLQVFHQVEACLEDDADVDASLAKLFVILQRFVKSEATKKRVDHTIASKVLLLQSIARALPLPSRFVDRVAPLVDTIDVLVRSDPKIVGVDLYALAALPNKQWIKLEHKVDYLSALAEEQHGSVSVSINRASATNNHVDFIVQQILSTSVKNLKGELNVTLIHEPGVGVGVTREFFQLVQQSFFDPLFMGVDSNSSNAKVDDVATHVAAIGSQWLEHARSETTQRRRTAHRNGGGRGSSAAAAALATLPRTDDVLKLFPLFEFVNRATSDELRIRARPIRVLRSVVDAARASSQPLRMADVVVDRTERQALEKLYQCAGRLLGLAIRNHQPLRAHFAPACWQFVLHESVNWQAYCGSDAVFQRSLAFVLAHDFDATPLEMHFEFTTDVVVIERTTDSADAAVASAAAAATAAPSPPTVSMEMQLEPLVRSSNTRASSSLSAPPPSQAPRAVTNANKHEYVELRAQQRFFGHDASLYRKLRDGVRETIDRHDLALFRADELAHLAQGEQHIDIAVLRASVVVGCGHHSNSNALRYARVLELFWDVVATFDQAQLAQLLTFWSGSPQPPLFGFASTARSMTSDAAIWYIEVDVRMKSSHLPMANTCDRRLILPDYPTADVLKEKLTIALSLGAVGYDRM